MKWKTTIAIIVKIPKELVNWLKVTSDILSMYISYVKSNVHVNNKIELTSL